MNPTRSFAIARASILAFLASFGLAGLLKAEEYEGKFTLAFESRWGRMTLPAGEYTFKLDTDIHPYTVKVTGKDGATFVYADGATNDKPGGRSELLLVRRGNKGTIRALHLAPEGLFFTYAVPLSERQLVAEGPQLIQRLPVVLSGK